MKVQAFSNHLNADGTFCSRGNVSGASQQSDWSRWIVTSRTSQITSWNQFGFQGFQAHLKKGPIHCSCLGKSCSTALLWRTRNVSPTAKLLWTLTFPSALWQVLNDRLWHHPSGHVSSVWSSTRTPHWLKPRKLAEGFSFKVRVRAWRLLNF